MDTAILPLSKEKIKENIEQYWFSCFSNFQKHAEYVFKKFDNDCKASEPNQPLVLCLACRFVDKGSKSSTRVLLTSVISMCH